MIIESDISRLSVDAGELVRLPDPVGATIAVMSGRVWVTQDRDLRDIVLSAGDRFEIEGGEMVLVQALEAANVAVLPAVEKRASASHHRVPEARSFDLPSGWTGGAGSWAPAWPGRA